MKQNIQLPIRIKMLMLCASLAASMVACGTPAQPAPAQPAAPAIPEVAIEFTGAEFKVPANVPGGIVSLTISNTGGKPMDIGVSRMLPGKTAEDVSKWLKETPEDYACLMKLLSFVVSLNPVAPGKPEHVVTDLKTGDFMLDAADHVEGPTPPDAKHIIHVFKADKAVGTMEPKPDVKLELKDFAYVMADEVKAGKQLWQVNNNGTQWHMMLLVKPNEGVSVDTVVKAVTAMDDSQAGPPQFETVGGVAPISEGERLWVEMDLKPGTYVLFCPLPDFSTASGGPPMSHASHGMHKVIVVK